MSQVHGSAGQAALLPSARSCAFACVSNALLSAGCTRSQATGGLILDRCKQYI